MTSVSLSSSIQRLVQCMWDKWDIYSILSVKVWLTVPGRCSHGESSASASHSSPHSQTASSACEAPTRQQPWWRQGPASAQCAGQCWRSRQSWQSPGSCRRTSSHSPGTCREPWGCGSAGASEDPPPPQGSRACPRPDWGLLPAGQAGTELWRGREDTQQPR